MFKYYLNELRFVRIAADVCRLYSKCVGMIEAFLSLTVVRP